jgi:hypothetical protein
MNTEAEKEEVFMYKKEFAGHGHWSLNNMAKVRFSILIVTKRAVTF